jgi:hypothetical protein
MLCMSEEVRHTPPGEEISECWERISGGEAHLRSVGVYTEESLGGYWQVGLSAGEYFRDDALGQELDQRLVSALLAVPGVTSASRANWESWDVTGTPSGEALCRAAAHVVDDLADRMRAEYDGQP